MSLYRSRSLYGQVSELNKNEKMKKKNIPSPSGGKPDPPAWQADATSMGLPIILDYN